MVSATTADSRLSTAASSATVNADGSSGKMRSARNGGISIRGRPPGMPPNLDPIVSTGRPNAATAAVAATSATIEPGTRGARRGITRTTASEVAASASAAGFHCGSPAASAVMRLKNSLGGSGMARPRKSLICVAAMSSAMPLVNPITTGLGMNFTARPNPVTARNTRMAPAIMVTINNPDMPCVAMMPATITTNAPVGPLIWMLEPPSSDTRNPPTIAV